MEARGRSLKGWNGRKQWRRDMVSCRTRLQGQESWRRISLAWKGIAYEGRYASQCDQNPMSVEVVACDRYDRLAAGQMSSCKAYIGTDIAFLYWSQVRSLISAPKPAQPWSWSLFSDRRGVKIVAVTSKTRDDLECETVVDLEWCNRATLYTYAKTAQRQVVAFFSATIRLIPSSSKNYRLLKSMMILTENEWKPVSSNQYLLMSSRPNDIFVFKSWFLKGFPWRPSFKRIQNTDHTTSPLCNPFETQDRCRL